MSCRNYAIGQASLGNDVRVYTLQGYPNTTNAVRLPSPVIQIVKSVDRPVRLGCSKALRTALRMDSDADVYHLHGIWLRAMYYGYEKARRKHRPYLIEINGALDPLELATKPWRKRFARWWFQDRMLRDAYCIHVNSTREAEHVRALGFTKPIVVIPAGFNAVEFDELRKQSELIRPDWAQRLAGRRILLYLSRIHPAKGIDELLQAWSLLAAKFEEWDLLVVGPGDVGEIERRKVECYTTGIADRCHFTGLVSDVDRAWAYANAELYVLPSHKENFGNTVQEALGSETPVVTTKQTPWTDLEKWGCGWVCADTVESIVRTLECALAESASELEAKGKIGRSIILKNFSLTQVVNEQMDVYAWLNGGPKPDCLWMK